MSYYEIAFPALAESICHIKLPEKFRERENSYYVSHFSRSAYGKDEEEAAYKEIHNLTDILERNGVPYELSNRGTVENVDSDFRTFFYPCFPKGSNGTLKMTVDYYDYESNPSSIEDEAKKYVEENRREDEFYHGFDPTEYDPWDDDVWDDEQGIHPDSCRHDMRPLR